MGPLRNRGAPQRRLRIAAGCLMAGLVALAPLEAGGTQPERASYGIWTNPQRSVRVKVHPCAPAMCGTVVWANDKAQADARKGGTEQLVGAQLFSGFVRENETTWRGKVFVPDLRKTFSGTITTVDERTMRATGCLLGRVGCKSQVWTRMD